MSRIETRCVQGGYTPKNGEPRQIPIIQSTTFKYDTSEDMGKLFDLEASGYFYTRLQNPTNDTVAARICALEGGTAAMLTSSGQAANFYSVFNIANAGDHVVACSAIYGGTYNLFAVTMKKMGIDFTFVSPDCTAAELDAAFRPNTKALFGETIANPALCVLDIEMFAKAAHKHGVPLIVDASQSAGILDRSMESSRTYERRMAFTNAPPPGPRSFLAVSTAMFTADCQGSPVWKKTWAAARETRRRICWLTLPLRACLMRRESRKCLWRKYSKRSEATAAFAGKSPERRSSRQSSRETPSFSHAVRAERACSRTPSEMREVFNGLPFCRFLGENALPRTGNGADANSII